MAARKLPGRPGEPPPEPEEYLLLLGPDDEDLLDDDRTDDDRAGDGSGDDAGDGTGGRTGPDGSHRSSDEFLAGILDRGPGVTHALTLAGERLRGAARRHPRTTGIAALCAVALGLGAAVYATRPKPSSFAARVTAGSHRLNGADGVVSTLTVTNPTGGPVTLTGLAIGGRNGQDIGLAQAAVNLPIPAGGSREVELRGLLDCVAAQPALPSLILLTGTDARGLSRSVTAVMPGSADFSAGIDSYRRDICRVPYPLGVTNITYGGLLGNAAYPWDTTTMRLNVSVTTVPGMDPTPVKIATVLSDLPGVRAMMLSPELTVAPGSTGTIDVGWYVDDCSRVPGYAGIPALEIIGIDRRATQIWDYALGKQFGDDLAAGLRAACPPSATPSQAPS